MNEATLYLKDGQSHAICTPAGRLFHEILHCMRVPADAAGRTLYLQAPAGAAINVLAKDIAGLELPPPHALIPDFMTEAELEQILAFTLAHAEAFQNSGTYDKPTPENSTTGRRSHVLDGPANAAMASIIGPKVFGLMPKLWPRLHLNPLPLNSLECQVTAHGDGDFFATHTDNSPADIAYRRISYVYYFHREPKQFSGGHLCLYNTRIQGGYDTCGGSRPTSTRPVTAS